MVDITIGFAFIGGILSFFSPCIVPLIPAYLSHISGTSVSQLQKKQSKKLQLKVFSNAVAFVLGFTVVFILLGLALGALGSVIPGFQIWLARIGGTIIIIFGLHTIGLLKIPFLERTHGMKIPIKTGYLSSSALGASFGVGWSPCVGPILAAILVTAGASASAAQGAVLLAVYSIGLAIPFLLTGLFTSYIANLIQRANRFYGIVNIIAGILLIALGIIVFTNNFTRFLSYLVFTFPVLRNFFLG